MNLQEQYEKETGQKVIWYLDDMPHHNPRYVEWLESKLPQPILTDKEIKIEAEKVSENMVYTDMSLIAEIALMNLKMKALRSKNTKKWCTVSEDYNEVCLTLRPHLVSDDCTIGDLEYIYPDVDFSNVEIIEVEIIAKNQNR